MVSVWRMHLPRTRGDKPLLVKCITLNNIIYPAHAGINLSSDTANDLAANLPRTRGDKPPAEDADKTAQASTPHTRG